jgi:VanZ family protein
VVSKRFFVMTGWFVVAAIVVLSLAPAPSRPHSGLPGLFEHALAYSAASALLGIGYGAGRARARIGMLLVVLGAGLEVLQLWIPGRTSELIGFLGSFAGVGLGALAAMVLCRAVAEAPGRMRENGARGSAITDASIR